MTFPTCGSWGAGGTGTDGSGCWALEGVGVVDVAEGAAEEGRDQLGPAVADSWGVEVSLAVTSLEWEPEGCTIGRGAGLPDLTMLKWLDAAEGADEVVEVF